EPITDLHQADLPEIRSITITIRPDRDQWTNKLREATKAGKEPPPYPSEEVSIRVWRSGTTLEVQGEDRTAVEGLAQRISQILDHGGKTRSFPGDVLAIPLGVLLAFGLPSVLFAASHWLRLAKVNHKWDPAEIIAIAL